MERNNFYVEDEKNNRFNFNAETLNFAKIVKKVKILIFVEKIIFMNENAYRLKKTTGELLLLLI